MTKRFAATVATILSCAFALPGCPPPDQDGTEATLVGAWAFFTDPSNGCVGMDETPNLVALYANHTAELFGAEVHGGAWYYTNSTLTVTFPNALNVIHAFTGTFANSVVQNGTVTADDGSQITESCWNGLRVVS